MHRISWLLVLLLVSGPQGLLAQKSVKARPNIFEPELMRAQHVYQVNLFQTVRPTASTDPGNGRVMRVVGFPSRSYFFNSNGEVIREQQFNRENGFLQTEICWQKGTAQMLNGEQKTLALRQDIRTYTYRSEDPTDSLLALHQFIEYGYDRNGRLDWERTFEKNGWRITKVDSTSYIYQRSSDRKLAHKTIRFFEGGQTEMVSHEHVSPLSIQWTSDLGRQTLFTYFPSGELQKVKVSEAEFEHGWEHFYKKNRLDSTNFYTTFKNPEKEPVDYGSRFFYDKTGKMVMVRMYMDPKKIEEELLEYLTK